MDRQQIQDNIRIILADSGLVREAFVFGSFARGEDKPDSDIDLLVALEPSASLMDLIDIKLKLEDALLRTVDIGERVHPVLQDQVDQEKIKVYG